MSCKAFFEGVEDFQRLNQRERLLHLERETGIEPATNGLGSRYSTIELLPLRLQLYCGRRVRGSASAPYILASSAPALAAGCDSARMRHFFGHPSASSLPAFGRQPGGSNSLRLRQFTATPRRYFTLSAKG